jgi:hypothetical protein
MERGIADACLGPLWDPGAVRIAFDAGVGASRVTHRRQDRTAIGRSRRRDVGGEGVGTRHGDDGSRRHAGPAWRLRAGSLQGARRRTDELPLPGVWT